VVTASDPVQGFIFNPSIVCHDCTFLYFSSFPALFNLGLLCSDYWVDTIV